MRLGDGMITMRGKVAGVATTLAGLAGMRPARGPLRAAALAARRIAEGDLSTPVDVDCGGDLGALMGAMEAMRLSVSRMVETERTLRSSAQTRVADAIEGSQDAFVVVDARGRVAMANGQASMLMGFDGMIPAGTDVAGLLAGTSPEAAVVAAAPSGNHEIVETEVCEGFWLRTSRTRTREGGYVAITTDITIERLQSERLEATNRDFDAALANMAQGLCLIDADDRLRLANARFSTLFGLDAGIVTPGRDFAAIISDVAGRIGEAAAGARIAAFRARKGTSGSSIQELLDGRSISVSWSPMPCGGQIFVYEDATARLAGERRVAWLADHDVLTGLPNRKFLTERLEVTFATMDPAKGFALMYLDLDRFKAVNDTLGHSAGDELLRQVAVRLTRCVRRTDTVARLGGDEFAIVLPGEGRDADTEVVANRIVEALGTPFSIAGTSVSIGTSIGITCAPHGGDTTPTLLENADLALYRSKAEGRGTWRFYDGSMERRRTA